MPLILGSCQRRLKVMRVLALTGILGSALTLASCSSFHPEPPIPAGRNQPDPAEEKKLREIESAFARVLVSERDAKSQTELMGNLGYFGAKVDGGWRSGKYLAWHQAFSINGVHYRLLIFDFAGIHSFPGSQPVTIVLTKGDYSLLSWLEDASEESMFRAAQLTCTDGVSLFIEYDIRRVSPFYKKTEYQIRDDQIKQIGGRLRDQAANR